MTHSVCPEYTAQLLAARRICDIAVQELWSIQKIGTLLPGAFNKAASTLYGGYYEGLYVADSDWTTDLDMVGMSPPDAERVFKTAVGLVATDAQYEALMACPGQLPKVTKREVCHFEVVEILLPDEDTIRKFAGTKNIQGEAGKIQPLGMLKVIPWLNPAAPTEDLTREEELELSLQAAKANLERATQNLIPVKTGDSEPSEKFKIGEEGKGVELLVEATILHEVFVGMKFGCTIHTLDIGITYFDSISGIYPSFYTFLPSELMVNWKEPKPNDRAPPCVDDAETGVGDDDGGADDGFE